MANIANKSLALLNSKAPFANSAGKDSLDIALIFGSFEQAVSLFFQGDGVWQLISGQDGNIISVKDYLKTFAAFEFYDIENVYVSEKSLQERNLMDDFHIDEVQVLSSIEFAEKLSSHQTILRF
jgi:tRNA 2-thiouridine synthesizing protein C